MHPLKTTAGWLNSQFGECVKNPLMLFWTSNSRQWKRTHSFAWLSSRYLDVLLEATPSDTSISLKVTGEQ